MIRLEERALENALARLGNVGTQLPQIAGQVQDEALGHMIQGAKRSIYDTATGAYERTHDLLRGLDTRVRVATANIATVEVAGTAPYHAYVEFGTGATAISAGQAQAYALANVGSGPLYLGRSGVNYSLPGPIVAPAQAYAALRLRQLFVKAVREAR